MSTFLFSKPKLIDCIASVIDLFGEYSIYNNSHKIQEADRKATASDLQALQKDFIVAFGQLNKECQKRKNNTFKK
ncbi:MAG: hypothetical protein ACTTKH_03285 [Treponema sp.]